MSRNLVGIESLNVNPLIPENNGVYTPDFTILKSKGRHKNTVTFTLSEDTVRNVIKSVNNFNNYHSSKEELYVTAIRNLLKKNNYLNLALKLSEGDISEDEFDKEIENNPKEYIIELNEIKDEDTLYHITELVKNIGKSFTIGEVSELFSIEDDSIINTYNKIAHHGINKSISI